MNETLQSIITMCCCPECKQPFSSDTMPFRCKSSSNYICNKCLQKSYELQDSKTTGQFKVNNKISLKIKKGADFNIFSQLFFSIDYALLSFVYRENIAAYLQESEKKHIPKQNESHQEEVKVEQANAKEEPTKMPEPEEKESFHEIDERIPMDKIKLNIYQKQATTIGMISYTENKDKEEKVIYCNKCNKACNLLNKPIKLVCKNKEHGLCEICVVKSLYYDGGVTLKCPIDGQIQKYDNITECEFVHSFTISLIRKYSTKFPLDEIYELTLSCFQEEARIASKDIIRENKCIEECYMRCPKCKDSFTEYNKPISMPCSHCFCSECIKKCSEPSTRIIKCPLDSSTILCTLDEYSNYCSISVDTYLLEYILNWKCLKAMSSIVKMLNPEVADPDKDSCQICFNSYNSNDHAKIIMHQVKELPHEICKNCLSDMLKKQMAQHAGKFTCPHCNFEIEVPSDAGEALKKLMCKK